MSDPIDQDVPDASHLQALADWDEANQPRSNTPHYGAQMNIALAEIFMRITLIRDAHGFDLEEVMPIDGVSILPVGPTTYQVTLPVPMYGTSVLVTVLMPGITTIPEAFALLRDKGTFIPMIQAAAQAKEVEVSANLAKRSAGVQVIRG